MGLFVVDKDGTRWMWCRSRWIRNTWTTTLETIGIITRAGTKSTRIHPIRTRTTRIRRIRIRRGAHRTRVCLVSKSESQLRVYLTPRGWLHLTEYGQPIPYAGIGLSRPACALAHRLSACGPRAHLLDGLSAGARRRRHAGDAHGGPGPGPQPRRLCRGRPEDLRWLGIRWQEGPDKGGAFCAVRAEPPPGGLSRCMAQAAAARLSLPLPLLAQGS
jgi:hypothetical protein